MCFDPLTLGSMALGAVGKAISGSEANASRNAQIEARNKATNDELARQAGYQDQASGLFDSAFSRFAPTTLATGLDTAKASSVGDILANQPMNVGSILTKGAAPQMAAAEGRSIAGAFDRNTARGTALGNLSGYGTQMADNGLALNDSGRKLATVSNFSRGSAALTPLEREVAGNNAYRAPSGLGDLLGFAGTLGSYAGGGGTLPFANIFKSAPQALPTVGVGKLY